MNAFIQVKIVDTEQGIYGNSYAIDQFLAEKKSHFIIEGERRERGERVREQMKLHTQEWGRRGFHHGKQ